MACNSNKGELHWSISIILFSLLAAGMAAFAWFKDIQNLLHLAS
jgi:hypothetical protein